MQLDIQRNGIVFRHEDGDVTIVRPGKFGTVGDEVEIDRSMADRFNLASGDVVSGERELIASVAGAESPESDRFETDSPWDYDERDEPAAVRGETIPQWLTARSVANERISVIDSINGLGPAAAMERPSPRLKRSSYERAIPSRWIETGAGGSRYEPTGRMLDYSAPLAFGAAGIVSGPHGSGVTRTLITIAAAVQANSTNAVLLILLMRARSEEITDWRRQFPAADIIVAPTGQHGALPEQTLRVANLVLAAAQRQTELGKDVVLLVDSFSALWGTMLEEEEAEDQTEADRAWSRQRIREWLQAAGDFSGEGILGSGLGGSLTVIGGVWQQAVDSEAEEEGEIHPHLRLTEHIISDASWRVRLSGALASDRLFPAIDSARSLSQFEDRLLPADLSSLHLDARRRLSGLSLGERHRILADAIVATSTFRELLHRLGGSD